MPPGKPLPSLAAPLIVAAMCLGVAPSASALFGRKPADPAPATLARADDRLLDEIEHAGFRFFAEQSHPQTGLVRDRARADGSPSPGVASIAATGFGLNAWVIATERGWTRRAVAVEHVRTTLRFLVNTAPRHHGFFYHFMAMDTGAREWNCELSSIDSALLYAGTIVAREYFADPEITALANRLLGDVDWEWFRHGGQLISLSWRDETGFSRYRWNKYSEHVLMSFLALGVSPHPLEAAYWNSWQRQPVGRYGDSIYLQEPPLFVNQFPQAFIDLRDRRDASVDFFRNTRLATLAQRQFCLDLRPEFPAMSENLWGITASDSATGYKAWGGPPRTLKDNALDGTIVPCATAGSLPFAPEETLAVLRHLRTGYGDRIWKRYGFVDAFNPQTGWVASDVLGIDLGISVTQAENLRTGLIWRMFMQSPEAKLALGKAGFLSTARSLPAVQRDTVLARAATAWRSLQAQPAGFGLQLTALVSAHLLGFVSARDVLRDARDGLAHMPLPENAAAAAQAAAALITLRQAVPALAGEATARLATIDWNRFPAAAALGSADRLAVFLGVAAGRRPSRDWSALDRTTQALGPVYVLAPADAAGALIPGLWLDERAILTGASASQLAYASLATGAVPADAWLSVLQLDQFPAEALARALPGPASPGAAAACVITAANLLAGDAVRDAFQRDPLVQAGRAAIAEFGAAWFGPHTSVIARRELAGTDTLPPRRSIVATTDNRVPESWDWQTVAGAAFKDSEADILPGDPPLSFRFAVTWDAAALHFHAIVEDSPEGFVAPAHRERLVELFVDPDDDGLVWSSPKDRQFIFGPGAKPVEFFNHVPVEAVVTPTAHGYTVEAAIPWASLGLQPRPGLEIGISPAALARGFQEWEPAPKVNWSYVPRHAGEYRLGVVRLK
ncbi:MAG TPA: glucoamylase family protein [Lacunisphaera sp.]|nr:glucoamylase family protein [Lacunisphaera sp.]